MIEVFHEGFKQSGVDFELFERFGEVQDFVYVPDFGDSVGDEFVFLVEALDVFEVLTEVVLADLFVLVFGAEGVLEGAFDGGMGDFDFLLHVFGDGVTEGGEFDVDLDEVVVGECEYLVLQELLGRELGIEESVEVWIDDDFLLPVFHRLLVFINAHLILINPPQLGHYFHNPDKQTKKINNDRSNPRPRAASTQTTGSSTRR